MAYSLVGSAGAVTIGAAGAAVTPAWDAGASRSADNLLILLVVGWGNATLATVPGSWLGTQTTGWATLTAGIFYKIAAGGDAAPTIAAATGMTWAAQLLEFAGNATSSPLDQVGAATSALSPRLVTTNGTDAAAGELVAWVVVEGLAVITATMASSPNNGMIANDVTNNSTSTANHYLLGYGITTDNSANDANSVAFDDGAGDSLLGLIKSFKLAPPPPLPVQSTLRATMRARRY